MIVLIHVFSTQNFGFQQARKTFHIEKLIKEKTNGQQSKIPIHPSNVQITNLRLDKDRKALLARKKRDAGDKHKMKEMD